jgi:hypothetical protein
MTQGAELMVQNLNNTQWAQILQTQAFNAQQYPLTVNNYGRDQLLTLAQLSTLPAGASSNVPNLLQLATGNVAGLPLIQQTPFSVMPGLYGTFVAGNPASPAASPLGSFGINFSV